jgi:3-hydroxybutyryl-CoA dehydrogenase
MERFRQAFSWLIQHPIPHPFKFPKFAFQSQSMEIHKVAVIGAGTMGSGIAQVAATAGCSVQLVDAFPEALSRAEKNLHATLAKLVDKGKITPDESARIAANISYVSQMTELSNAQLIIEAIVENSDVKCALFAQLESIVSPDCILASNTSSLSIASIAASCKKSDRVIGIHFFNPAPLMQLVEVIPAVQTANDVLHVTLETIASWKKIVAVAKDTPGFIVNRVARPFYSEAIRLFEEGTADFATIDQAMKNIGFRMGPFELMDFIGNDVNYAVTESVFTAFYFDPRFKPSFTQKRLTEAGFLGRKSGRGYYDYREDAVHPIPKHDALIEKQISDRILVMLINEAADALFLNIASAQDIDHAMTKGVNYPKGLLAWADEKGIDWCVNALDALYNEYHEDRYRCSPMLRRMMREQTTFFN